MRSLACSRREFLAATTAAAAMACGFDIRRGSAQSAAEKALLEKRQPSGLKISCSSLAFSDMKWDGALAAIKGLGFRFADLAMFEGWAHVSPSTLTEPELLAGKITTVCAKLEIEPIAIHTQFALGDPAKFPGLTVADPAARKTILTHFERVVTCARLAEIPLINVQPGKFIDGIPREICLKNAAELLTQMLSMAARRGLILSFENHSGSVAEQPKDAEWLLTEVPGLRLDYDPSHVVANSISLEATLPLLKYIGHIGVRNAKPHDFNLPVSDDSLGFDLGQFLKAFRDANVNAYVSVEYFKPEMRDSIPRLKALLEREGISA